MVSFELEFKRKGPVIQKKGSAFMSQYIHLLLLYSPKAYTWFEQFVLKAMSLWNDQNEFSPWP